MAMAPLPYWRLSGFYLFYFALLGATAPFLALYFHHLGFSSARIGELVAIPMLMRCVAPNLWGWLGDYTGQRLLIVRLGALCTLLSFSLIFFSKSYAWLALVMALHAFFWHAVLPQFEVITLAHLREQSARYSQVRLWGSIGFIVVVVTYGWLIDRHGIAALPWLMLPLFALLALLAFANRYAQLPEEPARADDDGFRARLRKPQVRAFFVAAFLTQVSFGPFYTFFSIYLQDNGYTPTAQGLLWAVGVLVEIAVFFGSVAIFRRWNAGKVLLLALLAAALRWWATGLWPQQLAVMLLAQASHALNFGAFFAASMQLLARFFPGRMNGHGQGVFYGLSSGVGGVAGALLAGQLWRFGGNVAFIASGFIALLAAAIAWRWLVVEPAATNAS